MVKRARATQSHGSEGKRAKLELSSSGETKQNANADSKVSKVPAPRFVVPLPVECAYYDESFLSREEANRFLGALSGNGVNWATSWTSKHPTALYGDTGVQYRGPRRAAEDLPGFGYASDTMNAWTPDILELKTKAEQWHLKHTGLKVIFSTCLLNRYEGGQEFLGWHSDREELDPQLDAPRSSPIMSISLGAERRFGFRSKNVLGVEGEHDPITLGHGSLLVMENACQFLYQHSLLAEHKKNKKAKRARVNLTFRSHRPTRAAENVPVLGPVTSPAKIGSSVGTGSVFVGLTPGVNHTPNGLKERLHHPFETPFATDKAEVASLRYCTWLLAQPLFHSWVCKNLHGQNLQGGSDRKKRAKDMAHAKVLAAITGGFVEQTPVVPR